MWKAIPLTLATLLLRRALAPIVKSGSLTLIAPSGERLVFGDGTGAPVVARIRDERALWAMMLDPDLRTGELYADGRLTLERGDPLDFLSLILRHGDEVRTGRWFAPSTVCVRRPSSGGNGTIRAGRSAMSPITTTWATSSTASSSIPTGSIPAPTSNTRG